MISDTLQSLNSGPHTKFLTLHEMCIHQQAIHTFIINKLRLKNIIFIN